MINSMHVKTRHGVIAEHGCVNKKEGWCLCVKFWASTMKNLRDTEEKHQLENTAVCEREDVVGPLKFPTPSSVHYKHNTRHVEFDFQHCQSVELKQAF